MTKYNVVKLIPGARSMVIAGGFDNYDEAYQHVSEGHTVCDDSEDTYVVLPYEE